LLLGGVVDLSLCRFVSRMKLHHKRRSLFSFLFRSVSRFYPLSFVPFFPPPPPFSLYQPDHRVLLPAVCIFFFYYLSLRFAVFCLHIPTVCPEPSSPFSLFFFPTLLPLALTPHFSDVDFLPVTTPVFNLTPYIFEFFLPIFSL